MTTKFLELKWKEFSRAPQFGAKLAVKVLIGFFIIYFSLAAIFFSGISVFLLEKKFPDQSPLSIVNSYLLYYFVFAFIVRYFFQSLPATEIQQLLITPIIKKNIVAFTINFLPSQTVFTRAIKSIESSSLKLLFSRLFIYL